LFVCLFDIQKLLTDLNQIKPGFHPNAIAYVACKQQPIEFSVEAVATMIGCLPTQALAFSPVSIQTQRTQRKRLRLDGNRALGRQIELRPMTNRIWITYQFYHFSICERAS